MSDAPPGSSGAPRPISLACRVCGSSERFGAAAGIALATVPRMDVRPQVRPEWRRLAELIAQIEIAMLVTAEPDGSLRSRSPLQRGSPSAKIGETDEHRRVSLSYMHPASERYVWASGVTQIARAAQRANQIRAHIAGRRPRESHQPTEKTRREHS